MKVVRKSVFTICARKRMRQDLPNKRAKLPDRGRKTGVGEQPETPKRATRVESKVIGALCVWGLLLKKV